MPSMLNHTPDSQARNGAAAPSPDGRRPFVQPTLQPLRSLRELTRDQHFDFTVQESVGTPM